jgi:predicted metal-dependent enzyme (double-stranded beta helix superfamily)
MTDITTLIHQRVPAGHTLERAEMAALARQIGEAEALWRPFVEHDANERHFVQLYRDPSVDVWLICWDNAQDTGYHDHDQSSGAVYVCEGMLCEDSFFRDPDGWIRERTREHQAGGGFDFPPAHIHGVRHPGGSPATSIHVYSPALWRMGHYQYDTNGIMGRVSITYADELAESV